MLLLLVESCAASWACADRGLAASEVLLRNDPSLMTPENVSGALLLLVSKHFWLQGHDLPLLCTEFLQDCDLDLQQYSFVVLNLVQCPSSPL